MLFAVEFSREFVGKLPPRNLKGATFLPNSLENLTLNNEIMFPMSFIHTCFLSPRPYNYSLYTPLGDSSIAMLRRGLIGVASHTATPEGCRNGWLPLSDASGIHAPKMCIKSS